MLQLTSVAIMAILGIVAFNRTANLHKHYLGGGVIITHAHPYDKSTESSPFKAHDHGTAGPFATDGLIELSLPVSFDVEPLVREFPLELTLSPSGVVVVSAYGIPGSREPPHVKN